MKHYCDTIPLTLAEKLKENGMPITYHPLFTPECEGADQSVGLIRPTFAECFDWLFSERNLYIWFLPTWDSPSDSHLNYEYRITRMIVPFKEHTDDVSYSWHEAANAAIEKALTLI